MQSTEPDQHHKPTRKGGRFETEQAEGLRRLAMNEQMPPAVTGPVEQTVRSPLGMPDYTPDQKAAAFDALWEACGLGRGLLRDWVGRPVSRAAKEATFIRVPRYTFEILAEGEGMQRFRDVLHHLATRKGHNPPS